MEPPFASARFSPIISRRSRGRGRSFTSLCAADRECSRRLSPWPVVYCLSRAVRAWPWRRGFLAAGSAGASLGRWGTLLGMHGASLARGLRRVRPLVESTFCVVSAASSDIVEIFEMVELEEEAERLDCTETVEAEEAIDGVTEAREVIEGVGDESESEASEASPSCSVSIRIASASTFASALASAPTSVHAFMPAPAPAAVLS